MVNNSLIHKNGSTVIYNNHQATIKVIDTESIAIVYNDNGGNGVVLSHEEFFNQHNISFYFPQDKKPAHTDLQLTDEDICEIKRMKEYLKGLAKATRGFGRGVGGKKLRESVIEIVSAKINDFCPPTASTLGQWKKNENELVQGAAIKCFAKSRRRDGSMFSDEVMLLVFEAIEKWLLDEELVAISIAYDAFREKLKQHMPNIAPNAYPCYDTFRKYVKQIPFALLSKQRLSKNEYKKEMRVAKKKLRTCRPLERVEADGLYLQVGLKDENDNYLGPVTLILLIDVHTRCILGYSMSIGKGETSSGVIQAIRHAVCRKPHDSFHSDKGNDWFCFGAIEDLVVDGGSAFGSIETQSFVTGNGCASTVVTLPSYSPWLKPFIERLNLTIRLRFASLLPGYVGRRENQKKIEYSMKELATLAVFEFKALLESWIVDVYHHTPHSGLNGQTPYQAWFQSIQKGWFPESPVKEHKIALPAGESTTATILGDVCQTGIHIKNVEYNDLDGRLKKLGMQLKQLGKKAIVECFYNDNDISSIAVLDPYTMEKFEVPAKDECIFKGMTRVQFSANRKPTYADKGKTQGNAFVLNPLLLAKREELQQTKNELSETKKVRQRRAIPADFEQEIKEQQTSKLDEYLISPSVNSVHLIDDEDDDDDEIFDMD